MPGDSPGLAQPRETLSRLNIGEEEALYLTARPGQQLSPGCLQRSLCRTDP